MRIFSLLILTCNIFSTVPAMVDGVGIKPQKILDMTDSEVPKKASQTILIHIGKCAGGSVTDALKKADSNYLLDIVHLQKPLYRKNCQYIIVARNPINRMISAFNWQYHRNVETGNERERFPLEYEVLTKYQSLNALAEALYTNGEPNLSVHEELKIIHHCKHDIAYYLKEFLQVCPPEQILGVIMQENFKEDFLRIFGFECTKFEHDNKNSSRDKTLTELARQNLMLYLYEDYEALLHLYLIGKISKTAFIKAL